MQRLEVSGAVRPLYGSLGVKGLNLSDFKENGIFSKEFRKIQCHENASIGNRVLLSGQTDTHDEANSRFSIFCERAKINVEQKCLVFRTKTANETTAHVAQMVQQFGGRCHSYHYIL